jgi:hypothetical protein
VSTKHEPPQGKERPILFSAPMIRALLAGTKTQTRRACKGLALEWLGPENFTPEFVANPGNHLCPYGNPGDLLWVRETHLNWWHNTEPRTFSHVAAYAADGYELQPGERWIPSIHMLRAASRILLEVTEVRVQRLQDISHEDAEQEGVKCDMSARTFRDHYAALWDRINGPGSWDANPWCWAISFRRITP